MEFSLRDVMMRFAPIGRYRHRCCWKGRGPPGRTTLTSPSPTTIWAMCTSPRGTTLRHWSTTGMRWGSGSRRWAKAGGTPVISEAMDAFGVWRIQCFGPWWSSSRLGGICSVPRRSGGANKHSGHLHPSILRGNMQCLNGTPEVQLNMFYKVYSLY